MRITFVAPTADLSGGARVIAIYAEALARAGHQVLVVYPAPRAEPLRRRLRALLRGEGWQAPQRSSASHYDGRSFERRMIDPWRPIRDADIPDGDIVIATWWETAEWVAALSDAKGVKVYFVQHHETVFPSVPIERVEATYRLPLRKIAIAEWLVEIMATRYGDRDVKLVPNGVDLEQFRAPERGKQATPTVGYLHSRVPFKGSDIVFRAVEIARKTIPSLRVVAFGALGPTPEFPAPAGTSFVIAPAQDAIRQVYAQCDAWIFSSRSEGFGLPLLEAMACRTPLVATPVGAAPELLVQGGGILVKPEDPDDMARAMIQICQLPDEQWRAESARAHAIASTHGWTVCATQFEQALTAIATAARSSQPSRSA